MYVFVAYRYTNTDKQIKYKPKCREEDATTTTTTKMVRVYTRTLSAWQEGEGGGGNDNAFLLIFLCINILNAHKYYLIRTRTSYKNKPIFIIMCVLIWGSVIYTWRWRYTHTEYFHHTRATPKSLCAHINKNICTKRDTTDHLARQTKRLEEDFFFFTEFSNKKLTFAYNYIPERTKKNFFFNQIKLALQIQKQNTVLLKPNGFQMALSNKSETKDRI